MALTPDVAQRWTEALSQELTQRRPTVEERIKYYRGDLGKLRFATDEFAQYHGDRFAGFDDNWCKPVVDSAAERMTLQGIRLGESMRADAELARVWDATDADRGSSEAFTMFMASAYAFALVHPGASPDDWPRITWEHPTQAIVDRDPVTGDIRAGLVTWIDDEHDHATLYTADEVWRWQRSRSPDAWDSKLPTPGGGWVPRVAAGDDWVTPNVLGAVPLAELRNQTLLDDVPLSDISGTMVMQDTINLTWAYLLNALDYASLPGRVVTGAEEPREPILDAQGQETGLTRPIPLDRLVKERILWIPSDATIGEWTAANLAAFSQVIEHAVEHVAAQTRTPPHYLIAKMVNTAAEALTVAEAGLVSRVRERILFAKAPLRRIFRLLSLASGDEQKAQACRTGTLLWANPQYRSEAQLADALQKRRDMGYPLRWIAEQDGLEPAEVDRLIQMAREEDDDPVLARLAGGDGSPGEPAV